MEKIIISEEQVKLIIDKILSEEKVKREDYNRTQFKIDELESSIRDSLKEFRKMNEMIPSGLKPVLSGKVSELSGHINDALKVLDDIKVKIKKHKTKTYKQSIVEKK